MNETPDLVYLIEGIVSLVVLICFFVLCAKVSKINKKLLTDKDEYYLAKMMGNKEKAYYHLQRHMYMKYKDDYMPESAAQSFYLEFKELGFGIPDLEYLNRCKEKDERKNDE